MSVVRETCGCGAEWEGNSALRSDCDKFREAHAPCRNRQQQSPDPHQERFDIPREALLLLAITHFDNERLLTDENLDATDLFERGLLQQREIGQTGEYQAELTVEGFQFLRDALGDPE